MSHYNIDSCFFDEYNLHKRMEDVGVNDERWEYDTDSDRIAAAVKSAEKTIYRFRLLAELERELFSKEDEGYTISEYNREKMIISQKFIIFYSPKFALFKNF